MEKEKVLIIGCGGAGNRMQDVLMGFDRRYTGIFLNSNQTEMENLEHYDADRRSFYIPNADGCGKDMDKMATFCKEESPKFIVLMQKFTMFKYVVFLTSANGGTGAMATMMYTKLLKKFFPDKSINVVATFPSLAETQIDFDNAIRFWNEMIKLKNESVIDSIQYIDNNKGSETSVNVMAMKELDESFNIVNGKLDTTDSSKVHTTNGYKVFLKLSKEIDLEKSIDRAIQKSAFFIPKNLDCDKIVGDININEFEVRDISKEIKYYDFSKFNETKNYRDEDNNLMKPNTKLLLGGCEMPKEVVELMKEALKDVKERKKSRIVHDDLIIKTEKSEEENVTPVKTKIKGRLSSKDLNDMFADDEFWN